MSEIAGTAAVRLRIRGRVQGVAYRAWLVGEASTRGLSGWVRNRLDGSVEAVIAGPPDAVEAVVEACHGGPPAARVDGIEREPAEVPSEKGFVARETA